MQMAINLTLLVQIVHFIIAYIILTRFLLRPGYKAVKSDANRERQLKSRIVSRQELIAHKQMYKRSRWELFQDYFSKQKPQMRKQVWASHPKKMDEEFPELSAQELDTVSDQIATSIKEKVAS